MRGLMGEIITRIEKKGLTIAAMKLIQMTREQAEKIYAMHIGKTFYDSLILHVTSGPILAMVITGPNVILFLRNLIGKTNPLKAQQGTIRGDLAINVQKNMIHGSDSSENAQKELKILFRPEEILHYQKPTEAQYLY